MKITEHPDGSRSLEGTPEELLAFETRRLVTVGPVQQPVLIPYVYVEPKYVEPLQPYTITYGDRVTGTAGTVLKVQS